ncbi:MAG: hypothetical protein VXX11_07150, partial [Planctomycetota bacterium]|nr:hypothetical protein [Planctomycetota bacterium]
RWVRHQATSGLTIAELLRFNHRVVAEVYGRWLRAVGHPEVSLWVASFFLTYPDQGWVKENSA